MKTEFFESFDDLLTAIRPGDFRNLFGGYFDAGQCAVMTDAKFDKPQLTQEIFGIFDLLKLFFGDRFAVRDSGGQTG